jgi:hypothetical protein
MKVRALSWWLPAVLLGGIVSHSANAQEPSWFGQSADGRWLIGAKVARVDKTTTGFSEETGYGFNFGYEFARPIGFDGSASLEFEYMSSDDGDFREESDLGIDGRYKVKSYGVFFAYRTPGTVFFKGKLGALYTKVDLDSTAGHEKQTDTNLGFGAGFGVRAGESVNIELEYTGSAGDSDVNFISLGVSVFF